MTQWGEWIEWDCSPVTLSDGTVVQPVFPWPDEVVSYQMDFGATDVFEAHRLDWGALPFDMGTLRITRFRLRADHHVYTKHRSIEGREPDRWIRHYPNTHRTYLTSTTWENREEMGAAPSLPPIGIWRVYLK